MLLPFDDVLKMNRLTLVLYVDPPAGDLVDIRAKHRLRDTRDLVETCFWKGPRPVALVVLQLGERVEKEKFQLSRWQRSCRVSNHAEFVEQWLDAARTALLLGHGEVLLVGTELAQFPGTLW